MMLDHYQQTKTLLVGYSEDTLGFLYAGFRSTSAARPWGPSS